MSKRLPSVGPLVVGMFWNPGLEKTLLSMTTRRPPPENVI